MSGIDLEDIRRAAKIGGLEDFTGKFTFLGGGEVNDTFILDCGEGQSILRIAKEPDQATLQQEARALKILDLPQVPKLLFFDEHQRIKDRLWILETYISGKQVIRLNAEQFRSLGILLARVHTTTNRGKVGINIWGRFLEACNTFGNEQFLLDHPDRQLNKLIQKSYSYFKANQASFNHLDLALLHGDATPSNTLVRGDEVSLIDWEFSRFNDPMAEFSTVYYDDMEYNKGKWRPQITDEERTSLFAGYLSEGGVIDEDRLKLWMFHDKLGAAVFLYWRIHQSTKESEPEQLTQYKLDFNNLIKSLEDYASKI